MAVRNKIKDLRNHLFEQLERLNDNDLDKEQMQIEKERSKAMVSLSDQLIEIAKTELNYMRFVGKDSSEFMNDQKAIEK